MVIEMETFTYYTMTVSPYLVQEKQSGVWPSRIRSEANHTQFSAVGKITTRASVVIAKVYLYRVSLQCDVVH